MFGVSPKWAGGRSFMESSDVVNVTSNVVRPSATCEHKVALHVLRHVEVSQDMYVQN